MEQHLKCRHWACQAHAVLKICDLVDFSTGTQKNRPQLDKAIHSGQTYPTYYLRPSNGYSSSGIWYPESLCSLVTDLTVEEHRASSC
eukprot:5242322-Pyramimonas_sp.AAC.1